ncbi:UNVERIFIED_CONTAM: DNA-binding MarR family transcriptional regulator [Acetivibrio alkalicellulosi]
MKDLVKVIIKNSGIIEKNEALFCGVNETQCQAIFEIGRAKRISLKELSEILLLDKMTMSRTIEYLAKNGIIVRSMKQEDRRYATIVLTKRGEEIFKRMEKRVENYYDRVISSIPDNKKDQVTESLGIFMKALDKNKCC